MYNDIGQQVSYTQIGHLCFSLA